MIEFLLFIIFQDEYIRAYYAALLKKQQELDEAAKNQQESSNKPISDGLSGASSNRQVGMKSKREEVEGDDDVDWEEVPVAGNCIEYHIKSIMMTSHYKRRCCLLHLLVYKFWLSNFNKVSTVTRLLMFEIREKLVNFQ